MFHFAPIESPDVPGCEGSIFPVEEMVDKGMVMETFGKLKGMTGVVFL